MQETMAITATEKVGVVTGGASGIGKAITGVLLKNGYKVIHFLFCFTLQTEYHFSLVTFSLQLQFGENTNCMHPKQRKIVQDCF